MQSFKSGCVSSALVTLRGSRWLGALALGLAVTSPTALAASGDVQCKDQSGASYTVKAKTISIHNDSGQTIYPALSTSANAVNEWLQACFRTQELLPTTFVTKLYVNEGVGIPAGSSVTITLPLYSQLSGASYITWWNGGRVMLADRTARMQNPKDSSLATPTEVTCAGTGTSCSLSTYSSTSQFPEDVYAQLSEYTFGASDFVGTDPVRVLRPDNVGYNISYVDHVYLPVAIGPKNNPYIGYSGSVQNLASFRQHLTDFLADDGLGDGWPMYNLGQWKLPGGYNIFAQRTNTVDNAPDIPVSTDPNLAPLLTVRKCVQGNCTEQEKRELRFGKAVQNMQNLWGSCVDWGSEDVRKWVTEKYQCPAELRDKLGVIKDFFAENHKTYLKLFAERGGGCKGNAPGVPVFNYWDAILHIYGWVPFNEGCGAGDNALGHTTIPGWNHLKTQQMYIHDLQYNYEQQAVKDDPKLTFNPYVKLIHQDLELSAYGFSVDDAVGFMSELGDGLIFTVGGSDGLENKDMFNYGGGFQVVVAAPPQKLNMNLNTPVLKKYGVCVFAGSGDSSDSSCDTVAQDVSMPLHTQILGFRVGTVKKYPIKVAFTDWKDNVYTFVVANRFAQCPIGANPANCPPDKPAFKAAIEATCKVVDSGGNPHPKAATFCGSLNPNQSLEDQVVKSFLSFGDLVDYDR